MMPHQDAPGTRYTLRVDFLPPAQLALPGRLGMTRAPGRWSIGRDFDSEVRLREDLETITREHAAKVLVTLLEPLELAELGDLGAASRRAVLTWIHFPIPDMWVPADHRAARGLVRDVLRSLERGHDVVVHCWGGLGRSGTIAALCLVARGSSPADAIALVRATRPGAIETAAQQLFVRDFAQAGSGAPRALPYK